MVFFLRRVCPVVSVLIFAGGVWLWLGGTYLDGHAKAKPNPDELFMNIFGLYFFLKCTFCSMVLFLLSRWMLLKLAPPRA